jgi:branched-subunit amino acid aminotransferase/4-amino-4-deoxychorismate lyase
VPCGEPDTVLRWSDDGLLPSGPEPSALVLTADSFLVDEGAVRGYERHWARFGASCAELGVANDVLAGFRRAAEAEIPRRGRWFPRVELLAPAGSDATSAGVAHLRLHVRAGGPSVPRARVMLGPPGDPRDRPRRKGPDLVALIALRERAVAAGADELVLRDDDGRLVEGALHSLLWWEHETLCTTPADRTLPGVTRALLLEIAGERGVEVRERSPLPPALDGRETWLTNAVHGIRVVTSWGEGGPAAGPGGHAPAWRALLQRTAVAIGG